MKIALLSKIFAILIYFEMFEIFNCNEEIPFNYKEVNRLLIESKNFDPAENINKNSNKVNINGNGIVSNNDSNIDKNTQYIPKSSFNSDLKVVSSAYSKTSVLNSALVENSTTAKLSINANTIKGESLKSSTIFVNEIHSTKGLITINGDVTISNVDNISPGNMRFKQMESIEKFHSSEFEKLKIEKDKFFNSNKVLNKRIPEEPVINIHHSNEFIIDDINQWYLYYIDSFDVFDNNLWKNHSENDLELCGSAHHFLSSLNKNKVYIFELDTNHQYLKIHFGLNLLGNWKKGDTIEVYIDNKITWRYLVSDNLYNDHSNIENKEYNCNNLVNDFAIGM